MKSEYKYRFWLKCAEATRTGWACLLVAAILLYVPGILTIAAVPELAPVLAVLVAGPSLGTVLHNSWGISTVAVPALTSTIAILHVIRPPLSQLASVACVGVSSVIIAYLSETHIWGRRVALAQISIVYVTAHFSPDMNVVTFPLKMLMPDVMGMVMAIVASLFPIPRLAVMEVRESAKRAARGSSELFTSLVKTISSSDSSTFGSMHLHSKIFAKAAIETIADLETKQENIRWELGACGARHANKRFTKGLRCLNLHLVAMEMALESGYILHTPAALRGLLPETLMKVVEQCRSLLDLAVQGLRRGQSSTSFNGKRQKVMEEGKETLKLLETSYHAAREQAYYIPSNTDSTENEFDVGPWQYRPGTSTSDFSYIKRKFRGRVSMLFFVFNLRLYLIEAINLVSVGPISGNKMYQAARFGPSVSKEQRLQENSCKTKQDFKTDSQLSSQIGRKCGPLFLQASGTASSRFSSCVNSGTLSRQSTHRAVGNSEGSQSATTAADVETIECNGAGLPPTGNVKLPSAVYQRCSHRNVSAFINSSGGGDAGSWKFLRKLGIKPSKTQTKRSLKTALSMSLATAFGFIVLRGKTEAFWAPVTVGFIIGNLQGGSWWISSLRLQGTVLGSIYGFLALTASSNHKWAILLLLTIWVIFSSYLRSSPVYGYSGVVSALTAAIMMLGGSQSNIKSFAMDRITQTFVGILCFVFVETAIFPERAVVLVRQELVSSLVSMRDCVGAIVSVYTEEDLQDCPQCRSLAVVQMKQHEQRLRASVAKQPVLSKEAALEPDLWFVPFPAEVYSNVIAIQGRMLDLLYFMVCSLHATTEDCVTEQIETLLKPLRTSLTALQDEVVSSLDFLQEVLQFEPTQKHRGKLQVRVKSWLGLCLGLRTRSSIPGAGGDVEQQPQGPPPHDPLVMLGRLDRSMEGIPKKLKFIMDSFERSFEEVFEDMIASIKVEGGQHHMLNNTVMLSVGSLTFSLHSLLRETVHLEKAVHELLQAESRWTVVDLWDNFGTGMFHSSSVRGSKPRA